MMQNWHKWALTLLLGFLGGVSTAAGDVGATFQDYARHGLIGMAPAIAALKMTLEKDAPLPPDFPGVKQ